jgi:hypothetical protein
LKWHRVWTNAYADKADLPRIDLDVYQTHYYPWMDDLRITDDSELGTTWFSPLRQRYQDLGLDRPMIVGELPLLSEAALDAVLANGYAGALPWSYWGDDGIPLDWTAYVTWEGVHAERVRIGGGRP